MLTQVGRQETPGSDADDGMAATAAKYGAKAAAQNTSIDSKIAIMERVLDRDDATGQDILKYEQRMSAIETLLDGNLSEVYTGWMEAVDETTELSSKETSEGF